MRRPGTIPLAFGLLSAGACQASEAPRVELPVIVDSSGLAAEVNDLGWTVELEQARVVVVDLRFTTAGEVHDHRDAGFQVSPPPPSASLRTPEPCRPGDAAAPGRQLLGRLGRVLLPTAHAHPGHYQGGEIIGELPGTHVVDFVNDDGRELGLATLIVGDYTALNFGLGRADELDADDPLLEHTALLRGTASKQVGDTTHNVAFTITIDSPEGREIVGAPFEYSVTETSAVEIGLRMLSVDPFEGDRLFDGIDFGLLDELDGAADGTLSLVDPELDEQQPAELDDAYYRIRREFQTHDLFDAIAIEP